MARRWFPRRGAVSAPANAGRGEAEAWIFAPRPNIFLDPDRTLEIYLVRVGGL